MPSPRPANVASASQVTCCAPPSLPYVPQVGGMSYEDNSAVVQLIENTPSGILPLLAEECFFPNGSDGSWLVKMKQAHTKNPAFSEDRMNKDAFTVHHYPGKVTYDSRGFLEKNKDPLSQAPVQPSSARA